MVVTIKIRNRWVELSDQDSDERLARELVDFVLSQIRDKETARRIYRRRLDRAVTECGIGKSLRRMAYRRDGIITNRVWNLRKMIAEEVLFRVITEG